jgi:hypothetical protein
MAGNDSSEFAVGANAQVHVGAVGSTLPTTASGAPDGAFTDLGFVDDDGFTITDGRTIVDIRSLQSFYPTRRLISERSFQAKFSLQQWNEDTIAFAFGGGSFTGDVYTPPDPSELDERALLITWQDGDNDFRFVFPKGLVTEDVETKVARTAVALLPITFAITPASGDDPWELIVEAPGVGS